MSVSPKEGEEGIPQEAKRTWKPTWAAIFLLLSFLIWLGIMAVFLVASPEIIENLPLQLVAGNATGTVEGRVIDYETSDPIEGVRVKMGRLPAITTDFDGGFAIEKAPIGIHELIISEVNHKTAKVKVAVWPEAWAKTPAFAPTEEIALTKDGGEGKVIEGESVKRVRGLITLGRGLIGVDSIPAILALLAAIYAFGRKSYKLTLVGSVVGIACVPFIPALIAMVLVILSKDEFFWAEVKGKAKKVS
jgi:hypothetical protein